MRHCDSEGHSGIIGPGDVQWMTAVRGIVHEEMHSDVFTRSGGMLELVQLWVNLPKKCKMTVPRYQEISAQEIGVVSLPDHAGSMRRIAGDYQQAKGAASTFIAINLWDICLQPNRGFTLELPESHNTLLLVLSSRLRVNLTAMLRANEVIQFSRCGSRLLLESSSESCVLLMSGEPIEEPIVGYGPFVMNTQEQIEQARTDFRAGRF